MRLQARNLSSLAVLVAALVGVSQAAKAQTAGFSVGYSDIGPALGMGNVGNASLAFGGRFERAINALPGLNDGTLGISASFEYYSYSTTNAHWKIVPIGVVANYHFKMTDTRIDPFVGAGLGYQVISCDYGDPGGSIDVCNNSAPYFIGRVGARYFFKPNMAAYVDAGAGAATLSLGVMFKLP